MFLGVWAAYLQRDQSTIYARFGVHLLRYDGGRYSYSVTPMVDLHLYFRVVCVICSCSLLGFNNLGMTSYVDALDPKDNGQGMIPNNIKAPLSIDL